MLRARVSVVQLGNNPINKGEVIILGHNGSDNRGTLEASLQLEAIFRAFPDLLFFMDADALTHTRPNRAAWSRQVALSHIQQSSGKLFDPVVVKAFLQVMRDRS